jgi:hypothetical protein
LKKIKTLGIGIEKIYMTRDPAGSGLKTHPVLEHCFSHPVKCECSFEFIHLFFGYSKLLKIILATRQRLANLERNMIRHPEHDLPSDPIERLQNTVKQMLKKLKGRCDLLSMSDPEFNAMYYVLV